MHGDFDLAEMSRIALQALAPALLFLLEPRCHSRERLRHRADRHAIFAAQRNVHAMPSEDQVKPRMNYRPRLTVYPRPDTPTTFWEWTLGALEGAIGADGGLID